VKRCWEGDDRDDGRRRQIRPQRERERERERERGMEGGTAGEREGLLAAVSMEEENSSEAVPARRRPHDRLYGGEISEREGGGCVGGGMKFHFPSNRFSSQKKMKNEKTK
jgi:hypothetical protein